MPGSDGLSIPRPLAIAGAIIFCFGVYYCLHTEVLVILKMASGLRERRYEFGIIFGFFSMTVLVMPLCIIPTGMFFVMACLLAYVYGLAGWFIAWPAFSCGLMLIFGIGRFLRNRREDDPGASLSESDLPECLQGKTSLAALRGSRRLLREQPTRTAFLLTFAMHSPSVQFLLGYASQLTFLENFPVCGLDGAKSLVPILKGLVLADFLDIVAAKRNAGKSATDDWRDYSMACVKLLVVMVMVIAMFVVAKAVQRELDEAELREEQGEQDHLLSSRRFSMASTTTQESQLGRFEGRAAEEGSNTVPAPSHAKRFSEVSSLHTSLHPPSGPLAAAAAAAAMGRSPRNSGERKGKVRASFRSVQSIHSSGTLGTQSEMFDIRSCLRSGRFEDDPSHKEALPPGSSMRSSSTRK